SIQDSDLIILALPISQIINFMSKIKNISKSKSLIIDVGSTKLKIAKKADELKLNFVGTHPLAGSEKKGLAFSSDELFNNSKVLITPTKNTDKRAVSKIKLFWKRLNAQTVIFSPKHHDKILSYTSHLPHLTAFCLINSIPKDFLAFGASGLKDTTRIALSDVQIWSDIILSNRKELLNSLSSFEKQIKDLKRIIQKGNNKQLIQILKKSKNKRRIIV
ncbi:prephenate dehydrogenase, partial [bacterium]|nr:prephenate dehydrogenase [bacterium]